MYISDERAFELIAKYGSPLYVYDEAILRKSCRDMHDLLPEKKLRVNFSAKANSNPELLKIVMDEDIDVDAIVACHAEHKKVTSKIQKNLL